MTFSQVCKTLDERRTEARRQADLHAGSIELLHEQIAGLRTDETEATGKAEQVASALDILRAYAELQEKSVRDRVAAIVTAGLRAVFDNDEITFKIRFELHRGQMAAVPVIMTEAGKHTVETEAADARGGGVLDVASFLLRCVMLVLYRPALERILFLDEVFKHLSRGHLPRAAQLVRQMSEKLQIQVVLNSHKDEFVDVADRVFDVSIEDGATSIERRD